MKKMSNRLFALLLVLVLVVGMLPVLPVSAAVTASTPKQITEHNYHTFGLTDKTFVGYYAIRTVNDLYGFANMVNGGENTASAVLLQDIVVNETVSASGSENVWTPIGNSDEIPYLGTFDGNGYTISGIYINGDASDVGLFGQVGMLNKTTGCVKNLTLANSYLSGSQKVGGIVAVLEGDHARIERCTVAADVTVTASHDDKPYVGGILGGFDSGLFSDPGTCVISQCVSLGKVSAPNAYGHVGGVSGYHHGTNITVLQVSDCYHIAGNTTNKNGTVNYGLGGPGSHSDLGCTQLSSATASHSCMSVTHREVYNTCNGFSGRSEYSFCLICGKVTSGTKKDYPYAGHVYLPATCQEPSHCRTCSLTEGTTNPNNHANTLWKVNPEDKSTHIYTHVCCGIVVKTENHSMDKNAYCATCDYTCEHTKTVGTVCQTCGATGALSYLNRYYDADDGKVYSTNALVPSYTSIQADTTSMKDGWYVLESDVTIESRIQVSGTVNLVLKDGYTLTATAGISTSGATLNIYGQTAGTGKLVATGADYNAAIGGNGSSACGTIVIAGGTIQATGGKQAPGIGRGRMSTSTTQDSVTILGGHVVATSAAQSTAIGSGNSNNTTRSNTPAITIRGGYVEARAPKHDSSHIPGIGGGSRANSCGTITISGGVVLAVGSHNEAPGIGSATYCNGGKIIISGGSVQSLTYNGTAKIGASKTDSSVESITDGKGNNVSLKQLTLSGAANGTPVTQAAGLSGYGLNDVMTTNTNKLYFFLPSGATATAFTAGGDAYNCTSDKTTFYAVHNWKDGTCTRCKATCQHNFDNSTCTLCGMACAHDYKRISYVAPKCYAQGFASYECTICAHSYYEILESLDHEWEYTDCENPMVCKLCGRNGDTPGHNYKQTVVKPTCTEDGYTLNTCQTCGNSYNTNPVTAPGHSGGTPTCTEPAKCTVCGQGYGDALGHIPEHDDDNCLTPIRCSVCQEITTAGFESHNFVDNLRCDRCGTNNTFSFTFIVDGQVYTTETVEATSFYNFPFLGEHNGLFFRGWDVDGDGEADYAGANSPSYIHVVEPMTFTALFGDVCQIRYYTVNIDTGEYQDYGALTVNVGEPTTLDAYYSYYHKFLGWATEPNGQPVYNEYETIIPTGNLTLYAVVRPFRATFDLGGSNVTWVDENGQPITMLECSVTNPSIDIVNNLPTRPGRQFLGFQDSYYTYEPWVDEETGDVYLSIYLTEDTRLVAVWSDCTEHSGGTPTCNGQKCDYCDEYYGEKDPTVHDENMVCLNGICPNGCTAPVAKIGDTTYMDLATALKVGGTVVLLSDLELTSHITVRMDTVLDLNGHSLVTTGYLTVYGDIIDGEMGGKGTMAAGKLHLMGQQSYLPIFDTDVDAYRFYAYQLQNLGGKASGENAVKFGIRLVLNNPDGYRVLDNTYSCHLTLQARVSWGDQSIALEYTFQDSTLYRYADKVCQKLVAGEENTLAIVLTVTGIDALGQNTALYLQPMLSAYCSSHMITGDTASYQR